MGIKVKLQIQLRPTLVDDGEVLFQTSAAEGVDDLPGEGVKVLFALKSQVEPGELVVESWAGKTGNGAAIDLLLLRSEIILLKKVSEAFIEEWIVGVTVDLTTKDSKCFRQTFRSCQTAKVAFEHLAVGEVVRRHDHGIARCGEVESGLAGGRRAGRLWLLF